MKTLAFIYLALIATCSLSQSIYTSEFVYPSFSFLSNNGHCFSNEDLSLFNDTILEFNLLSNGKEGFIFYAYSTVLGGVNSIAIEQAYQAQTIAFDNYVFQGLTDTIHVSFFINGNSIESFCPFFIPINPLSLTWGEIKVYQFGKYIVSEVQTLSETNSNRIELHISSDLVSWRLIDSKQTSGNSSTERNYLLKSMQELHSGTYYAKIVEVDFNGIKTESKILTFQYVSIGQTLLNYDLAGRQIK